MKRQQRLPKPPQSLLLLLLALLALTSCDNGKETLVIYSPHGRDLLTLVEETFEAQNPTVDLR